MKLIQKYYEYFLLIILCFGVLFLTINRYDSLDTYFHIKSGEVFFQKGIIFHDVFSYAAYGRLWVPYEWLFQIGIYQAQRLLGLNSLGILVSIFSIVQALFFYFFIRYLFKIPKYLTILLSTFYIIGILPFLVPRPTVVANLLFLAVSFIIMLYVYRNKNFLWLVIPITLIWTNLHGSFFLSIFLLATYTGVCLVNFLSSKDALWKTKIKILSIYTIITFLITLLPPLYGSSYKLLLLFVLNHSALRYIEEWNPLIFNVQLFITYSFFVLITIINFLIFKREKILNELLFTIPFWILLFIPYLAIRNLLYGYFAIAILLCLSIPATISYVKKTSVFYFLLIVLLISSFFFVPNYLVNPSEIEHYPTQAASFILSSRLKGNIYNRYTYGGYLLYRLYPQQKIFIDGRTDVYLCCELPKMLKLDQNQLSDSQYSKLFFDLLDFYHISYVLTTSWDPISQKDSRILAKDSKWDLVFWDDNAQIFVRKDGLNNEVINKYGTQAATPGDKQSPFVKTKISQALNEYLRMVSIADSSVSRNVLGLIYATQGNLSLAKSEFERAIQINSSYFPPYLNLAAILIREHNYSEAIPVLNEALNVDSTRPITYLYLGSIYIKIYHDKDKAKNIWQEGEASTTNTNSKKQFDQLINSL